MIAAARPLAETHPLVESVPAKVPENSGIATGLGTPAGAGWLCAATTVPSIDDQLARKQTRSWTAWTWIHIDAVASASPHTVGGAQVGVASWSPVSMRRKTSAWRVPAATGRVAIPNISR